jgi:hypothetical protein
MHKITAVIFVLTCTINTAYSAESREELRKKNHKNLAKLEEQKIAREAEEKIFNKELKIAEWQGDVAGFKTATITTLGMLTMTGGLTALTSPSPAHNIAGGIISFAGFCTTAYYLNGQKIQRKYLADLKKSTLDEKSKQIIENNFRSNARHSDLSYSGAYTTFLSCLFIKPSAFSSTLMGTVFATTCVKCLSCISTLKADKERKKEKTAVSLARSTAIPNVFKSSHFQKREYHKKVII